MNTQDKKRISKFLSLILRHSPDTINIKLDKNGWADVQELISKSARKRKVFNIKQLEEIVETNDKKRFIFSEDKSKIRANQGHSLKNVDLEMKSLEPPCFLFHGTIPRFLSDIKSKGLLKMSRQHVHLSEELETATKVGSRRGKPIILSVRSGDMHKAGFTFYCSENGVWLTDNVPSNYIDFK